MSQLPAEYRDECLALKRLSTKQLGQVGEASMPDSRQRRYSSLLDKNQAGILTDESANSLTASGLRRAD